MKRQVAGVALGLSLCVPGLVGGSHGQSVAGDTVYEVHGTVVNGATGKALSRALVFSPDRRLATMTDSAGHFHLQLSLPPRPDSGSTGFASAGPYAFGGELMLMAQRPGYLPTELPTMLAMDDKLSATECTLSIMPAGVLVGRGSAANTGSAHNVRVSLLQHRVQSGAYIWSQAGSATTNSHGEFRFGNLRAGEYTVMTAEWAGEVTAGQPGITVTDQYPPVYLGDASALANAGKLQIHPGEVAHTDLHLRLARYYPVRIPVSSPTTQAPVSVRVVGEGRNPGYALAYSAREGAVHGTLPNGSYTLLLTSNGQPSSFATVPLHVQGAPVELAPVTLAPEPRVPVRVHSEVSAKNSSAAVHLNVMLRSEDGGGMAQGSNQAGGDEFFVESAPPGEYFVDARPSGGYVSAMSANGVDLLHHPLALGSSSTAEAIDITVRDDGAVLSGKITAGDEPLPQRAFVLLLPTNSGAQFSQAFAGFDGSFSLSNLAPGTYRAFAVRSPSMQIPYRDPEAMHAYDGKGTTFTATAGEQVHVDVPLLDSVEGQVR